MSRESLGLSPHLQSYLLDVSLRDGEVQRELRELTAQRSDSNMQIAPEQGQFMALLVKLIEAKQILEIGTFTGYSALVMATALPAEGSITTLDINRDTGDIARRFWEKAGVSHKVRQLFGPASELLKTLEGPYDLVFIDADKTNYETYYECALRLLRPGGVVLLDNVLWGGKVADPDVDDADTNALRALNQKIHQDPRVELSLLPLADGLTVARKLGQ
jgi:predicted O-methyltransferase YrrM